MALDKLVDGAQLDSDLGDIADAIRAKGGTSAELEFPQGFVDAVEAIPTGITPTGTKNISITANGTTTEDVSSYANAEITVNVPSAGDYVAVDWLDKSKPVGDIYWTGSMTGQYSHQYLLIGRTKIDVFFAPETAQMSANVLQGSSVKKVIAPKAANVYSSCCMNATSLTAVDFKNPWIGASAFGGCVKLNVMVFRGSSVASLSNINAIGNTCFASGKAGGTLYVPQALIASYQSASNWSTILGYGSGAQNSIQAIEGSIYETQYVDGTPIS